MVWQELFLTPMILSNDMLQTCWRLTGLSCETIKFFYHKLPSYLVHGAAWENQIFKHSFRKYTIANSRVFNFCFFYIKLSKIQSFCSWKLSFEDEGVQELTFWQFLYSNLRFSNFPTLDKDLHLWFGGEGTSATTDNNGGLANEKWVQRLLSLLKRQGIHFNINCPMSAAYYWV